MNVKKLHMSLKISNFMIINNTVICFNSCTTYMQISSKYLRYARNSPTDWLMTLEIFLVVVLSLASLTLMS